VLLCWRLGREEIVRPRRQWLGLLRGPSASPLDCTSAERLTSYRPHRQHPWRCRCCGHRRVWTSIGARRAEPLSIRSPAAQWIDSLASGSDIRRSLGTVTIRLVWVARVWSSAAVGDRCAWSRDAIAWRRGIAHERLARLLRRVGRAGPFFCGDDNCSAAREVTTCTGAI